MGHNHQRSTAQRYISAHPQIWMLPRIRACTTRSSFARSTTATFRSFWSACLHSSVIRSARIAQRQGPWHQHNSNRRSRSIKDHSDSGIRNFVAYVNMSMKTSRNAAALQLSAGLTAKATHAGKNNALFSGLACTGTLRMLHIGLSAVLHRSSSSTPSSSISVSAPCGRRVWETTVNLVPPVCWRFESVPLVAAATSVVTAMGPPSEPWEGWSLTSRCVVASTPPPNTLRMWFPRKNHVSHVYATAVRSSYIESENCKGTHSQGGEEYCCMLATLRIPASTTPNQGRRCTRQ